MVIIRCCGGCFIYMLIFLSILALVALGIYLLVAPTNPVTGSNTGTTGSIIAAVICFILAFLIVLLVCCFRHRIALGASIIKVAAKFVSENCLIVLLPIFLFVVTIAFLVLWVLQALGFYSLGKAIDAKHQYPFQHFEITTEMKLSLIHI